MLFFHQERNHEFLSGKDKETHSPYLSALNICNSPVWNIEFDELEISPFRTWILQATTGRKIQFKLGKNPVYQAQYFKLENGKIQVQMDRRIGSLHWSLEYAWKIRYIIPRSYTGLTSLTGLTGLTYGYVPALGTWGEVRSIHLWFFLSVFALPRHL